MKRLTVFLAFLAVGAIVLSACGGGSGSGSTSGDAAVSAGGSGIKDPVLIGKWISADGGSGYDFKDDFSVIVSNVGSETKSTYNIVEGGQGSGKIEIGESAGKVVWDYKITDDLIELTTPDGRSRRMRKTT
ncbi:MAG: hypothetical protein M1546_11635 [Chloroflexi bacterium]|nr:hypothetical protein [Chloroflexota bacterium]